MTTYDICKIQAQYFTELVQYIGNVFRKIVYYILNIKINTKIYPRESESSREKDIHIYQVYNPYNNYNTGWDIEHEYEYVPPCKKSYEAHKQFDDYCDANIDRFVGFLERNG
jgi:hypothetical protein